MQSYILIARIGMIFAIIGAMVVHIGKKETQAARKGYAFLFLIVGIFAVTYGSIRVSELYLQLPKPIALAAAVSIMAFHVFCIAVTQKGSQWRTIVNFSVGAWVCMTLLVLVIG